jgi:hypothetical protein
VQVNISSSRCKFFQNGFIADCETHSEEKKIGNQGELKVLRARRSNPVKRAPL